MVRIYRVTLVTCNYDVIVLFLICNLEMILCCFTVVSISSHWICSVQYIILWIELQCIPIIHTFTTNSPVFFCCVWPLQRNLTEYFVAVDVNNMLHLYASMLYERRILICCSKLSTVSRVHFHYRLYSKALSMSVSVTYYSDVCYNL